MRCKGNYITGTKTAGWSGARFLFGSFAERLILTTEIPTLLINSKAKKIKAIKTILFPTDFSSESKKAYRKVLKKAHHLNAKVILFHQTEYSTIHLYRGDINKFKNSKIVSDWKNIGDKMDVSVKCVIKSGMKNKAESAINYAKKAQADLIAIVSRSGPSSSLILGSMTIQVARRSELPVWILHPKK